MNPAGMDYLALVAKQPAPGTPWTPYSTVKSIIDPLIPPPPPKEIPVYYLDVINACMRSNNTFICAVCGNVQWAKLSEPCFECGNRDQHEQVAVGQINQNFAQAHGCAEKLLQTLNYNLGRAAQRKFVWRGKPEQWTDPKPLHLYKRPEYRLEESVQGVQV